MKRETRKALWFVLGFAAAATAITVLAVHRFSRRQPRDPKVDKVKQLIAEADRLLNQFR